MRRHRLINGTSIALLLSALGMWALLAVRQGYLPVATLAGFAPVDLDVPDGYFLDWRLAALKSDRELCRRTVKRPKVAASEVADFVNGEGCGWRNGLKLASAGGAKVSIDRITCELTAALALWLAHEVQPQAVATLGEPIAAIEHRGGYACRNIRGSPTFAHWRSEHASANALDISAFVLANGRKVAVAKNWGADTPEARFLREIHERACRYFRVAIGPEYNAAHHDHFHYDRGPFRACR